MGTTHAGKSPAAPPSRSCACGATSPYGEDDNHDAFRLRLQALRLRLRKGRK